MENPTLYDEIQVIMTHVSPTHRRRLDTLLDDDLDEAYVLASILSDLYWKDDILEYAVEGCGV